MTLNQVTKAPILSRADQQGSTKRGILEEALGHLLEYSGVKAAVLVDNQGLIVAQKTRDNLDPEELGVWALNLQNSNSKLLYPLDHQGVERIQILTFNFWVNIDKILGFTLITIAQVSTDKLLSVRILQAMEMIKKHLEEKYSPEAYFNGEESYVSDTGGTK